METSLPSKGHVSLLLRRRDCEGIPSFAFSSQNEEIPGSVPSLARKRILPVSLYPNLRIFFRIRETCKGRDSTCILLFTETGSPFEKILFSCTNICIPFVGTKQGILFSHLSRVPSFTKCSFEKILFSWYPFARPSFLRKKGYYPVSLLLFTESKGYPFAIFVPTLGYPKFVTLKFFFVSLFTRKKR